VERGVGIEMKVQGKVRNNEFLIAYGSEGGAEH